MICINWKWLMLVTLTIVSFPVSPGIAQSERYPSMNYPSASNRSWLARRGSGVRRGEVCAISPGLMEEVNTIWSDRPVFAWKGSANQLIVRDFTTKEVLWSQTLDATTQVIAYGGTALQPGQTYQWQLLNAADDPAQVPWFMFQVMESTQRESVSAELQTIEQQTGLSAEAIALQKAEYLDAKGLWSDMLQVLYSTNSSSAAITEEIQSIINDACPVQDTSM